jgi:hypothetical protein
VALQEKVEGYDQPLALAELGFLRGEGQVFYAGKPDASPSMMRASLLDCAVLLCTPLKKKKLKFVSIIKVQYVVCPPPPHD